MPSSYSNLKQVLSLAAAPMAGISSSTFRLLCRRMGATVAFTEMISAKGLLHGNRRTRELLKIAPGERPVGAQLFGSEPETLAEAAAIVEEAGFDLVDINMGCPVRMVVSTGAGVSLMRDPALSCAIVAAVRRRAAIPVTAKVRAGWSADHINVVAFCRSLEEAGLCGVTVHPRTRDQGYGGRADWGLIAGVKARLSIPVVGNGDVKDPASARRLLEETGCDGIMVGRAALGNPWVFQRIRAALEEGVDRPAPPPAERFEVYLGHFQGLAQEAGTLRAFRVMKRFSTWYIRGLKGASGARAAIQSARSPEEMIAQVRRVLESA